MDHSTRIAREIIYASSAGTRRGRAVVRLLENATGRLALIRRARGYEEEVAGGRDFWSVMCERYGLGIEVIGGSLDTLPAEGPLVVVANHPYGILDGLLMGRILSDRRRGDFKIMAHQVFPARPNSTASSCPSTSRRRGRPGPRASPSGPRRCATSTEVAPSASSPAAPSPRRRDPWACRSTPSGAASPPR